jgi:hypothetical protein
MGRLISSSTVEERREIGKVLYRRVMAGERVVDIAAELGEHYTVVYGLIKGLGPLPKRPLPRPREHKERDDAIAQTYLSRRGVTMPQLAERYGLTKQRVKAIVDRYLRDQTGQPGSERLGRTRKQRSLALGGSAQSASG